MLLSSRKLRVGDPRLRKQVCPLAAHENLPGKAGLFALQPFELARCVRRAHVVFLPDAEIAPVTIAHCRADKRQVTSALLARTGLLLSVLAVTGACAAPATATGPTSTGPWRFAGSVVAIENEIVRSPIPGAQLAVLSGETVRARATTDAAGRYLFPSIETGRFTLTISAPGYASLAPTIAIDRDINADFALTRR